MISRTPQAQRAVHHFPALKPLIGMPAPAWLVTTPQDPAASFVAEATRTVPDHGMDWLRLNVDSTVRVVRIDAVGEIVEDVTGDAADMMVKLEVHARELHSRTQPSGKEPVSTGRHAMPEGGVR